MSWSICPAATRMTQGFGDTNYTGEWRAAWSPSGYWHAGVDLAADGIHGASVHATRDAVVVANQDPSHAIHICPEMGGGQVFEPYLGAECVILRIAEGKGPTVYLAYGHLNSAAVKPGDQVKAGQVIGYVGTHGASCGDHVHVEARLDGPWQGVWQGCPVIDPAPYLNGSAAPVVDQEDDDMSATLTATRPDGTRDVVLITPRGKMRHVVIAPDHQVTNNDKMGGSWCRLIDIWWIGDQLHVTGVGWQDGEGGDVFELYWEPTTGTWSEPWVRAAAA